MRFAGSHVRSYARSYARLYAKSHIRLHAKSHKHSSCEHDIIIAFFFGVNSNK